MKAQIFALIAAAFAAAPAIVHGQATVLIPWAHEWNFYHPVDGVDPNGADPDFDDTWFLKSGAGAGDFEAVYNGPTFNGPSTAEYDSGVGLGPLGYDIMNYFNAAGAEFTTFGTTLTLEASRAAMYFRSTFTVPAGGMASPTIRYLFDDGTFIYIDGVLVARVNVNATAANTTPAGNLLHPTFAADATATEDALATLDLAVQDNNNADQITVPNPILFLPPGQHTIAVTLRSNAAGSSDQGMALELSATPAPACVIGASASNVQRQTQGTPGPGDDTFSFDVAVTANGGSPLGWTTTLPAGGAGPASGTYPANVNYTMPAAGPVTLTFVDRADANCSAAVTVTPPDLPRTTILPWTHDWKFYHPIDGTDPSVADTDFNDTWFLKSGAGAGDFEAVYNGPSFDGPGDPLLFDAGTGPGPLGYDVMNYFTLAGAEFTGFGTTMTIESTGARAAMYFRSTFTVPAGGMINPTIRYMFDDGTFIYIDGVLVARVNIVDSGANVTAAGNLLHQDVFAADATLTEDQIDTLRLDVQDLDAADQITVPNPLPLLTAGTHTIAVTLRSNSATSSDAGMALELSGSAAPSCILSATASNVQRQTQGTPAPGDDTFSFTANVTATGGSAGGWTATLPAGATGPASGAYGAGVSYTVPIAPSATITFRDSADASCTVALTVNAPRLLELGQLIVGPSTTTIYNDPAVAAPAAWVAGAAPLTVVQNNGGGTVAHVLASETVNLSAINGTVNFTARLVAEENSDGTNFEMDDTFRIDLELNGPGGPTTVPLVPVALDVGDGAQGAANGPPNGVLNGYTGVDAADYDANVARDEFNATAAAYAGISGRTVDFSHVIPDSATSARLVITALNNSATETFTVSNIVFTTGAVGPADTDGDGQTDASETFAGTNPNDPNDYLRFTAITRAGAGANATFPSKAGKNYQAEVSTALGSGWTAFGPVTAGTGADITINIPQVPITPADLKYFLRIRVVP